MLKEVEQKDLGTGEYYEEVLAEVPGVVWAGRWCEGAGLQMNFVSRYVERVLGYGVEEWMEEGFFWKVVMPEDRGRVMEEMGRLVGERGKGVVACRWVGKDGKVVEVESHVTAAKGGMSVRGVTVDVTEGRRAEEALRVRNAELARAARSLKKSNEELDQYAYVTSHDLKAPLRGIANLSMWIEEDLGPRVTEEAHRQLEMLRGRVHRMEGLIEGILAYSRVGRVRVKVEEVEVGKLVREVVDLLAPPGGFGVEVEGEMPTVLGERMRLEQVFMNLIGNGIKHHGKEKGGWVKVSAREVGECYEFSVADNGQGIARAYQGKVWGMFQTLRPRDEVEGTGVGLSLVKKIVEEQGGVVKLESEEGRGAVFSFTWQKDVRRVREDFGEVKGEERRGA